MAKATTASQKPKKIMPVRLVCTGEEWKALHSVMRKVMSASPDSPLATLRQKIAKIEARRRERDGEV